MNIFSKNNIYKQEKTSRKNYSPNTESNITPLINAIKDMHNMEGVEKAVEGKTIESLSGNGYGVIIHFTDGTTYKSVGGTVTYNGLV